MNVSHPRPRADRIIFLLAVILIFLQTYRVPVTVIGPGLDNSFPHVLNLFAFTPTRFGTDIVYTYGPLGFLLHIENVRNNLATGFVFWSALYLLFSVSITYFIWRSTSGLQKFFSLILAISVTAFIDAEHLITCLVMLLLLISFEREKHKAWILAACCALSSVALQIKFPIGVACAGMTISSVVWSLQVRSIVRNLLIIVFSLSVSFCLLWFVESSSLHGIAAYFRNSLQLTSAYTAVMSSARGNENESLLAFAVALVSLVAMILMLPKARRLHTLSVMLFPLFVSWKSGVVRFDGHVLALVSVAMCSGLLLCVLHLSRKTSSTGERGGTDVSKLPNVGRQITAVLLFAVTCGGLNQGLVDMELSPDDRHSPLLSRNFQENMSGVANSWIPGLIPLRNALTFGEYRKKLDMLAAANLAEAKLGDGVLNIIGSSPVDIYSYELGFLAANPQLNYRPKPIFQHFNAFTQRLDQLNATFFASSRRPEFLMMHHSNNGKMDGVDGRHPLYDDPIAFLQIMNSYKTIFVEDDVRKPRVALLQHNGGNFARFGTPIAIKEETVGWDETISLPTVADSSVLRARIDLGRKPASILKEAVFRLSPMYLKYFLADGTTQRYRLVPPHLSSGVWISPLFEDYQSLYAFLGGVSWFGPKVVAIRFEADNASTFPAKFKLVWEKIDCVNGACGSAETRVFSTAGKTMPVLIQSTLLAQAISPVDSMSAIDVRLSTYSKVNEGTVTLQVLDSQGAVLRESKVGAASVLDNEYKLFAFAPLKEIKSAPLTLRLMYAPQKDGMLAAWRTSPTAAGFDFRIYGH